MSTDPRKEFGRAVSEIAETNDKIVVISADSGGSGGFRDFAAKHPDRYFEVGIAEQGATGVASGLATTGLIPLFTAIAPFSTTRNFEMSRNDLGYMRQNAKLVGRNGGFTYSDLGATHHSLEDYAIMSMIPGMVVFAPSDPGEIRSCAKAMFDYIGPTYTRIGGPALPDLFDEEPIEVGKGRHLREGSDVTIITCGYIATEVVQAIEALEAEGVSVDLIGMPTPSHLDAELITASAAKTKAVVTVEEHYVTGGLGGHVAQLLACEQPTRMCIIGVPHDYQPAGPYAGLLAHAGIDAASIQEKVKSFLT